ncbi:unnamed protein product [Sphagnum tenellum]
MSLFAGDLILEFPDHAMQQPPGSVKAELQSCGAFSTMVASLALAPDLPAEKLNAFFAHGSFQRRIRFMMMNLKPNSFTLLRTGHHRG